MSFRADDVVLNAGQTIEVPVKAKDFKNISGYQFTFAFDQSAIEFAGMEAGAIDCSNKLNYHYEVDAFANPNGNKSVDFSGITATINDVLPMGVHRVYWTVSDNCVNLASCNYFLS